MLATGKRRRDTDRRWQEVQGEHLMKCCEALSFLDAKGFRYCLPAFMMYELLHLEEDDNGILDSCL